MKRKVIFLLCSVLFIILYAIHTFHDWMVHKDMKFFIDDNLIEFFGYNDELLCLTEDGELIVYNKYGNKRKTNQSDIKYINTSNDLLFIKNDGSIICEIDKDTYEGKIIGNIPGAVRGDISDQCTIVTESGDLYLKRDRNEPMYGFLDTELLDGWTKINDFNNVVKATVFDRYTIIVLNNEGEVFFCRGSYNEHIISKISANHKIKDIVVNKYSLLLLDEQGHIYEYGGSVREEYGAWKGYLTEIECLSNINEILSSKLQGVIITKNQKAFLWGKKTVLTKGKSTRDDIYFGELKEQDWDTIIPTENDYFYVINGNSVSRIKKQSVCEKVEKW